MVSQPRKMPKISEIRAYWADSDRWAEQGVPWDEQGRHGDCFACGWPGSLRCHILARCKGGSDDVSNLHVLCPLCHEDSEGLDGRSYWSWIKQVDPAKNSDRCLIRQGISKAKLYSIPPEAITPELESLYLRWVNQILNREISGPEYLDRLASIGIDIRL